MVSGRVRLLEERMEHLRSSVLQMRNRLDRLHACMDGGKVGPSEGTRLIPNLIPSSAEETPGSFFANVWEILDYAFKVLDEEAGMRDMDASLSDRLIDANQLQDEVRITAGSHEMEKQLEDLAVKVGVLEGALDNHAGVDAQSIGQTSCLYGWG